jgi:subtilase family serine protease
VSVISGSFVTGETIVGAASGASRQLRIINTDDINDPYAQNEEIELEADQIIDFSEINPFGMP